MAVLELHKIDLFDPKVFPKQKKRWQSFMDTLAQEGLADTKHYDEISPETVLKLFELFNNVMIVLKSRGQDDYNIKLQLIPAKFHHRLNYLLQYMAQVEILVNYQTCVLNIYFIQFLLTMFECRRAGENLNESKKKDFKLIEDKTFKLSYWKQVELKAIVAFHYIVKH